MNVVMKRTGKSRAEAEQTVDGWIKTYQQASVKFEQAKKDAEVKARQVADDTASAASKAAIDAVEKAGGKVTVTKPVAAEAAE